MFRVHIFPNPTTDQLNINNLSKLNGEVKITLFNNVGKAVWYQEPDAGTDQLLINLEQMPAGVFYLKVESGGSGNYYKKVIKV